MRPIIVVGMDSVAWTVAGILYAEETRFSVKSVSRVLSETMTFFRQVRGHYRDLDGCMPKTQCDVWPILALNDVMRSYLLPSLPHGKFFIRRRTRAD